MARKPDIQYIQYYTDGSAARQPEIRPRRRKPMPQSRTHQAQKRVTVRVAPMALCGILVAAVMLVLMVVGVVRLDSAKQQQLEMERYVASLQERNEKLQEEYAAGYDPETVRNAALALGMVPAEQIQRIPMPVEEPPVEEEPTVWQRITGFFTDLFA